MTQQHLWQDFTPPRKPRVTGGRVFWWTLAVMLALFVGVMLAVMS